MKARFEIITEETIERLKATNSKLLYKLESEITDYVKVLGTRGIKRLDSDKEYGPYWILSTKHGIQVIYGRSIKSVASENTQTVGTRPVIEFSSIEHLAKKISSSGIERYQLGEYPQTFAPMAVQEELESLYIENKLKPTGKSYTRNISRLRKKDDIELHSLPEYEYKGKKYVRVTQIVESHGYYAQNKESLEHFPAYWVEVEPITWLVDRENDIAISEKILFSGIIYDKRKLHHTEYQRYQPILDMYLNGYFKYEIGEKGIIDEKETEHYQYIAFTSRLIQKLTKEVIGFQVTDALDDITLLLVDLVSEENIVKNISKEELMFKLLNNIFSIKRVRNKNSRVLFSDIIKEIKYNNALSMEAREKAIAQLKKLEPWEEFEDHCYYTEYPTYRLILKKSE